MTLAEKVLQMAMNAVPAVKYAAGISGIVASIAIISSFQLDYRIAVFGVVVMMVLMVALFIFSKLTAIANKHLLYPMLIMLWVFILITVLSAILLFTSVFFNYPIQLKNMFGVVEEVNTSPGIGAYRCSTAEVELVNCRVYEENGLQIYFESQSMDDSRFPHVGGMECLNNSCLVELKTAECFGCTATVLSPSSEMIPDGVVNISIAKEKKNKKNKWNGVWTKYGISVSFDMVKL